MKEVEEEYKNVGEFHLNGNATLKEDFADTGAVKLAFEAYRAWMLNDPTPEPLPIGLSAFTHEKLFWISHAQTFCSSERPAKSRNRVETGRYSLERFRVNGPLSNSDYFAATFNCSESTKMVKQDANKCLLW